MIEQVSHGRRAFARTSGGLALPSLPPPLPLNNPLLQSGMYEACSGADTSQIRARCMHWGLASAAGSSGRVSRTQNFGLPWAWPAPRHASSVAESSRANRMLQRRTRGPAARQPLPPLSAVCRPVHASVTAAMVYDARLRRYGCEAARGAPVQVGRAYCLKVLMLRASSRAKAVAVASQRAYS